MAVPENSVDKIIGFFEGTVTAPDPGIASLNYTEVSFDTGFSDTCLTRCVFSKDSGVTWNDDNMESRGSPNLQVSSFSRSNTAGIALINVGGGASSTAYTAQYKIFCYAKSDQGEVTPVETQQALAYSSNYNFEKIYLEGTVDLTTSTVGRVTTSVIHDLGYIPDTKVSLEYLSGTQNGSIWPIRAALFGDLIVFPNQAPGYVRLTDTTMTITLDTTAAGAINTRLHYRIYLDD